MLLVLTNYQAKIFPVAQCNNSYIFPGIGLGVVSANINRITDKMLQVASETLAASSPLANTGKGELLPPLTSITQLSKDIAFVSSSLCMSNDFSKYS